MVLKHRNAIQKTCESIRKYVVKAEPKELPFENKFFDFVLAIRSFIVAKNAIDVLSDEVSNGQSFITLATYSNKEDYQLFKLDTSWQLDIKEEWIQILEYVNYNGYYWFTDIKTLNLKSS